MLKGIDISHHNTAGNIQNWIDTNGEPDFIIHKLTEGKTYVDPKVYERTALILDKLCGYYHYARPDNNKPKEEAVHFCSSLPLFVEGNSNVLFILDWEGNALNYPFEWALEWCAEVEKTEGRKPIIYASASVIKKYADRYDLWWTAHYNQSCSDGCEHDGVNEVMTQYTNTPIDTDIFHGNEEKWRSIGYAEIALPLNGERLATWIDSGYEYSVWREKHV